MDAEVVDDERPKDESVASGRGTPKRGSTDDEQTRESRPTEVAADLDALLEDTKRERDEYLDLAQRAKADFENYRKRTVREAADAERRGKLALARELVPSLDSLERALGAAEPGSEVARGLELVHGELIGTLGGRASRRSTPRASGSTPPTAR